ncbi:asparagine synthase-related protein [Natrinema thermotolerans]|uniref:Asparagine synthase-related protein n=1 Tax=Natrinema thermotolerans TaxID=121872 RepID=A0AAF0PF56_9EURY|nr:asparagine synthase-related protein [Natrinema thermotolerans]QCC60455.1 hypothetical protein DVR14_18185 [Natrinema thermotolerans]QCC61358.1 hypothetical protein DVR14_22315 [Natrinema thermotolerans]WMT07488.1 asparagine synthase-related protein [Natrinema thermotolerans]WMT08120.1 asparagine synthase-related protein [Natrinema thermotolerans]
MSPMLAYPKVLQYYYIGVDAFLSKMGLKYDNLLYSRGYLLTEEQYDNSGAVPASWKSTSVGRYAIRYSSNLEISTSSVDDTEIVCIGRILDCRAKTFDIDKVTMSLGERYEESRAKFFDRLDYLAGRFLLLVHSTDSTFIVTDATANRSAFYNIDVPAVASHPTLLADVTGMSEDPDAVAFRDSNVYQSHRDSYFPGIKTPYQSIRSLTPNTLLEIPEMTIERFYPRSQRTERSVADVAGEVAELLKSQVQLLSDSKPLAVSLTAGLDSRLTLAATRNVADDVLYYTLVFDDESRKEAAIARELCTALDLNHRTVNVPNNVGDKFYTFFSENVAGMSSPFRARMGKALLEQYPSNRLHLKSNVAEVGRTFYRDSYAFLPEADAAMQSRLYGIAHDSKFVRGAFQEFIEKTAFDPSGNAGFDPYDLYYWEHRIGIWQGLSLLEWDIAQDTHILFNCRRLLELTLSVPYEDRRHNRLFHNLIEKLWPETMTLPIDAHDSERKVMRNLKPIRRMVATALLYR